jgi:hypothetical protein
LPTGSLGAAEGLGVMVVTDMAPHGSMGAISSSSALPRTNGEGGAISVMELRDSGALLPVDHVFDTTATRFGNLLALDVVDVEGRTYVVAAGGDGGITLFTLLPDGRLHLLDVSPPTRARAGATSRAGKLVGRRIASRLRDQRGGGGLLSHHPLDRTRG